MVSQAFRKGDLVVYRQTKFSQKPGPRASDIQPSPNGDQYRYIVEKYWIVIGKNENNQLLIKTPGGKNRTLDPGDPNLRHLRWWEKLLLNKERLASLKQYIDVPKNGVATSN